MAETLDNRRTIMDESETVRQLTDQLLQLRQRYAEMERSLSVFLARDKEWKETFDSINDAITVHDRDFTILQSNNAAENLFGLPSASLAGQKCYKLYHCSTSPPYDCPCFELFKTGLAAAAEQFEPHLNKYLEIKVFPLFDQDAEIVKVVHVARDVTTRKHLEQELKESEEKYRSLVETTDDSIYIVDRECRYIYINKKHLLRLGISTDNYIGKAYAEYHSPEETGWFTGKIDEVFETGGAYRYEHTSKRDNNHFLLTLSPISSAKGQIYAVSIISKNITEFKNMQDKLRMLAMTDDLTGLYNRRGFFSLAEHQLRIADRMKKGLFLFYADIDNLKDINDKFGHNEGDQLIKKTADILKDSFRNSDIIARIGGDEFVIFPVDAEEGTPDVILERLKSKMETIGRGTATKYSISLSIGNAYYDPAKPCSIEELLGIADTSMYKGKISRGKSK